MVNPVNDEQDKRNKILLIEDDLLLANLVAQNLEQRGFEVTKALRADDGLRKAYRNHPDLVLLDIMMPDMDGFDVCRRLRELSDVPIIFATAKAERASVIRGLELGADDYVIKPYDYDELVARINANLRRMPVQTIVEEMVFEGGRFRINFVTRELRIENRMIHLTPKEFSLLGVLVRNNGKIVTRTDLIKEAWGPQYTDTAPDSLKLYIHYLRQKIERDPDHPEFIITSRGVGYRFMGR